ncbi:sensor histidine kinase [Phyllobacterium phragmitis]|uniref:histidine kinase n=1 Tax=Phyllobacterium phragmitis TaxID=2670329 RepID=A0A2S9IKS2_9HYPH|nr:sensor histidine kinase [Phyllobacterium phragmitis]PRD41133.1 sensor histidine kinase [Phyllobacterium phragmitis]
MNDWLKRFLAMLPYIGLAAAVFLGCWSFLRADSYRAQTDLISNQISEIQWLSSQAREKIAHVTGYLQLPKLTEDQQRQLVQNVRLLDFNLNTLLSLNYVESFLNTADIGRLQRALETVDKEILPLVEAGNQCDEALARVLAMEEDLFRVSSAAVDHSRTFSETARIETEAAKNRLIFAFALGSLIITAILIHQRIMFARRKDRHLRSFSSLFAHMTRTRISALCLFLQDLNSNEKPDPEMVEAARQAAIELDNINDGLMKISYSGRNAGREPLCDILETIKLERSCHIELRISPAACVLPVPASQIGLIVDELVRNAEKAVCDTQNPKITINAWLKKRYFRRPRLVLNVIDNGPGMNPDVLKKATDPFFSTKAGRHVGLGLTSCSEMLKAIAGKLEIMSTSGVGTSVQIEYPLKA